MNQKGVFRTALATTGLLITYKPGFTKFKLKVKIKQAYHNKTNKKLLKLNKLYLLKLTKPNQTKPN